MVVGASSRYGAAVARIGSDRDGIRNGGKVGDEIPIALYSEGVIGVVGDHAAVFSPVGEGVTRGSGGVHGAALTIVVGVAACYGAAIGGISRHCNGVGVESEIGYQVAIGIYREGIVGIGRDHATILSPVGEGVTRGSCSAHGAALAIVIGAAARDGAAICGIG